MKNLIFFKLIVLFLTAVLPVNPLSAQKKKIKIYFAVGLPPIE